MPSTPFNPGSEAVAAVDFTYAGVKYAKGAAFPHRELKIIEFDLLGLWRGDRIAFTSQPCAVTSASPSAATSTSKPQPAKPSQPNPLLAKR